MSKSGSSMVSPRVLSLFGDLPVETYVLPESSLSLLSHQALLVLLSHILPEELYSAPDDIVVEAAKALLRSPSLLMGSMEEVSKAHYDRLKQRRDALRPEKATELVPLDVQFAEFRTAVWDELLSLHAHINWIQMVLLGAEESQYEPPARAHEEDQ